MYVTYTFNNLLELSISISKVSPISTTFDIVLKKYSSRREVREFLRILRPPKMTKKIAKVPMYEH